MRIASGNDKLIINLDRTKTEITVDSKGSVTIKGSRSVSVEAGTDLTLSARRRLTIKSGGPLDIEGRGLVNLKSLGGAVTVDAMGALSLKAVGAATLTMRRQRAGQLHRECGHSGHHARLAGCGAGQQQAVSAAVTAGTYFRSRRVAL